MNTKIKLPLLNSYSGKLISSLTFLLCICGQGIQPSWAEGSKELTSYGGDRPYMEWASGTTATIARQTTLQVYVQAGETVNLGSSVPTSANGTQDIVYISPSGVVAVGKSGSCDVLSTGFGFINTLAKEVAGPLPNVGGYTPCSFVAAETGIYKVQFHAPNTVNNPPPIAVTAQFPTDATQNSAVAAWDITVRSSGVAQTGRVFTNYIAMNLGNNGLSLNSKLYIQTKDGYRYKMEMNGMDPFGFIFFANSRGFIDNTTNASNNFTKSTIYHSIGDAGDNVTVIFPGNVGVQLPTVADTNTDITHLVFFNPPATSTLTALGIPLTSTLPVDPTSFQFIGGTGGSGNQTKVGVGGYFSFNVNQSGSYQIVIDTDNNGVYDPSVDRILQNSSSIGSNVVLWDGKNASGANLPARAGNAPYNAIITARAGEYHFPILDPENNPNGFKIVMENPPGPFSSIADGFKDVNGLALTASTIYYNDSNYTTANGTAINLTGTGSPSPPNAVLGIDSGTTGRHGFTSNYGNLKGIDTWTYFSSKGVTTPLVITASNQANVKGTKSVKFLTDTDLSSSVSVGDIVQYTITYSNLNPGDSNAINFIIKDTLPTQLTYVSAAITSQTSGNNIALNPSYTGTAAGSVNLTNTNANGLRVADTITITINARINNANAGNPISNQASADFTTPDNALATVVTVLTDALPTTGATNPPAVGANFLQTADDSINTGNDPSSTSDDDPTLFTAVVLPPPQLLLVKRITAINSTPKTGFVANTSGTDTTDPQWPLNTTYLQGLINGGVVLSGDVLEYTVYFLSTGGVAATNVAICDLVPSNTTFLATGFNGDTTIPNDGVAGSYGIAMGWNASALPNPTLEPTTSFRLTGAADSDSGQFYPAGDPTTPSLCGSNTNGAVVVKVGGATGIPKATGSGIPFNSYGFIRFKATVK
jgi:uncharacterized repeat protein (TIGR01451 family)